MQGGAIIEHCTIKSDDTVAADVDMMQRVRRDQGQRAELGNKKCSKQGGAGINRLKCCGIGRNVWIVSHYLVT